MGSTQSTWGIKIPRERERGATAMKITLVNFIIATVIIVTIVKAGPMRVQIELTPMSENSGPKTQASGAYRSGACSSKGQACRLPKDCCSNDCRNMSLGVMQCE